MPSECIAKPLQRELADSITRMANPDDLRILIACGAKVNESVTQGLKPIHYAVWQRYPEAVHLLLVRGCDVNTTDDCGYSPLHLATEHGYLEIMKILLEFGAKRDYRFDDGVLFPRTTLCDEPLRLAIKNNHFKAARLLLDQGANPNARYFFGSEINLISPMDVEYLELLLTYGANPDTRDRSGLTPLMRAARLPQAIESVLCLISYGANVNGRTDERNDFRTVIHYAVLSGNYQTVELLLKQGANVNFESDYQKPTPLDLAILKGDPTLVKILIDAGADVNASSPIIGTPLHVASSDNIQSRLTIFRILLQRGADPNRMVNCEDGMPMKSVLGEYLSSNQQIDESIIRILLEYGARVILKSQFRDPSGILNYLSNLSRTDPWLLKEMIGIAESFDPSMIRRCPALSAEQKDFALEMSRNPRSLKQLCRLFLRKHLGQSIPPKINELGLPKTLSLFLLYDYS